MNEAESSTEAVVTQSIAGILKQRKTGMTVFGVTSGLAFILAVILTNTNRDKLVPIVLGVLLGSGATALMRVFGTKCPACGKPFFAAPARSFYAKTCYHCKAGPDAEQSVQPPT